MCGTCINLPFCRARFLRRREAKIDRDHPLFRAYQLQQAREAAAAGMPRPANFDDVLARFDEQIPDMIGQILGARITDEEAVELNARLSEFPALSSTVRANLYLWAIPIIHDAGAARDKNDDYRHIIESSYAQVFITGDGQLARTAPRIRPSVRVLTWQELQATPTEFDDDVP
jgi:hypothetical protein